MYGLFFKSMMEETNLFLSGCAFLREYTMCRLARNTTAEMRYARPQEELGVARGRARIPLSHSIGVCQSYSWFTGRDASLSFVTGLQAVQ